MDLCTTAAELSLIKGKSGLDVHNLVEITEWRPALTGRTRSSSLTAVHPA